MHRRGSSHGHKNSCPYCGGNHSANECPMLKYPPAMPMPSVPVPPMGGMGNVAGGMGGMPAGMGGMPAGMGGMPAGGMGDMMGMMGMMHEMHEHMHTVERLLHEIHHCCMENNALVKEIHMQMAKG